MLFLKLKDQSYRLCTFNKQNNEKRLKKNENRTRFEPTSFECLTHPVKCTH